MSGIDCDINIPVEEIQNGDIITANGGVAGHAGIIEKTGNGIKVIEAYLDDEGKVEIQRTPLCDFLKRYEEEGREVFISSPEAGEEQRDKAVSQVGEKVGHDFTKLEYFLNLLIDQANIYYCSELVDEAYQGQGLNLGPDEPGGYSPPSWSPLCPGIYCLDGSVKIVDVKIEELTVSDKDTWGHVLDKLGAFRSGVKSKARKKAKKKGKDKLEPVERSCESGCDCRFRQSFSITDSETREIPEKKIGVPLNRERNNDPDGLWESFKEGVKRATIDPYLDYVTIKGKVDVKYKLVIEIGFCIEEGSAVEVLEFLAELLKELKKRLGDGDIDLEDLGGMLDKTTPQHLRESDNVEDPVKIHTE